MKPSQQIQTLKLVIVGEGNVGKTCILQSYINSQFSEEYKATIFENYTCRIEIQGIQVNLNIWDTAGQEQYGQLRKLAYPNSDIFLIAFSIVDQASFQEVMNKWISELLTPEHQKATKIIIGNKIDLREDPKEKSLSQEQIVKQLKDAFQDKVIYKECSAKTAKGIKEIFDTAIIKALQAKGIIKTGTGRKENPNNKGSQKKCKIF